MRTKQLHVVATGTARLSSGSAGRRLTALLASVCLTAPALRAQMHMEFEVPHQSYLKFEAIIAKVTVLNKTDQFKSFGESLGDDAGFHLRIRDSRNEILDPLKEESMTDSALLKPGDKREMIVDVSLWYPVATEGRYMISAVLTQGNRSVESKSSLIDVVPGIETTSQSHSVPGEAERTYRYSLRYWSRNRTEHQFLRVDETATGVNYGVFDLGKLVRTAKSTLIVEIGGDVLVVHQSAPLAYTHSRFKASREGIEFVKQSLHLENGAPFPLATAERSSP